MKALGLIPRQRSQLQAQQHYARDARVARRAQAVLWHAQGRSVAQIAQLLGLCVQTIYNWIARYQNGDATLVDRPRSGRPRRLEPHQAWVEQQLQQDPQTLGYRQTTWTVPLLQQHLGQERQCAASLRTLRRTLHALGYRWKRPRYVLARRDPKRQQKKGRSAA